MRCSFTERFRARLLLTVVINKSSVLWRSDKRNHWPVFFFSLDLVIPIHIISNVLRKTSPRKGSGDLQLQQSAAYMKTNWSQDTITLSFFFGTKAWLANCTWQFLEICKVILYKFGLLNFSLCSSTSLLGHFTRTAYLVRGGRAEDIGGVIWFSGRAVGDQSWPTEYNRLTWERRLLIKCYWGGGG